MTDNQMYDVDRQARDETNRAYDEQLARKRLLDAQTELATQRLKNYWFMQRLYDTANSGGND